MHLLSEESLSRYTSNRRVTAFLGAAVVLLSLAFLAYLIYRSWPTLRAIDTELDFGQIALTLLFNICAYVIAIWSWHSIMTRLSGQRNLRLDAIVYCYSAVARRLPGIAWDIAARVVMYDQAGVSKALVALASLLEMLLIIVAGIVSYLALAPFTLSYLSIPGSWALICALLVGGILIHPAVVTYGVHKVRKDKLPVSLQYSDTLYWLFMYVLTWIVSGFLLYATIRSFYGLSPTHLPQLLADWALAGVLTSFITFVPTGLGLKELTLTLLMSRYMPEPIAAIGAVSVRLLTTGYSIVWAVIFNRWANSAGSSA